MSAYLFKAGDDLRLTNYDQDIVFEEELYRADQTLLEISATQTVSDFPSHKVSILCLAGSAQYDFFASGPIRQEAAIYWVEEETQPDGAILWIRRWAFEGQLGSGSMVSNIYQVQVEEQVEIVLNNPPILYWNSQLQKMRPNNEDDISLDGLENLNRGDLNTWKGSDYD